jgi:phenylalanyl-tRNA synthetase beta chain
MLISLEWLNELIDLKTVNFEDLLETLTLGGFEVENSYELNINNKKDTIIDITTTPNRSDTLSFKGIAKEISSLANKFSQLSKYGNKICDTERLILNSILKIPNLDKEKKNYSIFCTITVENIKTFYSPNWLKQKLLRIGIEPSNNILDLKDYIRLETGYPFELYDLDKIRLAINNKNFKLSLNCEKLLEPFQGSNNFQFTGNSNILVLKANQEILSIAEVIENIVNTISSEDL